MDKRVYLLTIVSFVVGMVELIIGGILDLVATDLGVSLGKAGFLITIFSLVFAIAGPILLVMTAKIERKRLTLFFLLIFSLGNLIAVISPSYSILFIGRIISAASGSLLIVLCLTMATNIVAKRYRARAIGIVVMGVSGSIVLGLPIGLILGNAFGWRAPFVMITILTLISMTGVYFFMGKVAPKPAIPIGKQLATLKSRKIFFAQLTTFLFLAGHLTIYAYLTPFLKTTMGMTGTWISMAYLIFGVAAVAGGGIGGVLSDRIGPRKTIISVIIVFGLILFAIPYSTFSVPVFLVILTIWGMLSWSITPAMQSYLIEASPETSDIQQSLNNSALHFGIAFGSFLGGIAIEHISVEHNATIGGMFLILALVAAAVSMAKSREKVMA
ncbi:DHA1 family purine base/nucleoside efflux pump-like MFS transporter [Virgibacillus halotolerans]|uniref:MFS transporter n=1 Tax=Virgibacillus halotolerans TaxID=1071053 RepID=UPI001961FCE5|nr:MFS transporter [Virgibacillus halotolerans]MBM7599656.1 DHA1 family purine base/nucleoside efflux pump-like MFS transporter [Virgibacillus halotolerans]